MNTTLPSYETQKNKILDAYFSDKIEPMNSRFCFCGTLSPDRSWRMQASGYYPYKPAEYCRMEDALFNGIMWVTKESNGNRWRQCSNYEDGIFEGLVNALDVLKSIHKEHGQIISEDIPLTKRKLETVK